MNSNKKLWGTCLLIISITMFIRTFSSILGIELSDIVIKIIGIISLITLTIFIYSSVKILKLKKR